MKQRCTMLSLKSYDRFRKFAENFQTVKQRVQALYDAFPTTIQSDYELIRHYDFFFRNSKYTEDTIKRWGRKFRQEYPEVYNRSPDRAVADYMAQEYVQKTMGDYNAKA